MMFGHLFCRSDGLADTKTKRHIGLDYKQWTRANSKHERVLDALTLDAAVSSMRATMVRCLQGIHKHSNHFGALIKKG